MSLSDKYLNFKKGDYYILFAMLIFGTYPLFLRFYPQISTLSFLFFFQIVGAFSFLFLQLRRGLPKITTNSFILFITLSFVALGNDLSYFLAFRLTSVANAAIGHQMVSIFVLFLGRFLLKEKTKSYEYMALVISLIGLLIIYYQGLAINKFQDVLGISLSLLSALFYAFLIIHYRYLSLKNLSITTINFFRFTLSSFLLFPGILFFKGFNFTSQDLLPLVSFGLLFAVIASGIHNFGMTKTKSLHASIIGKSEPVIAIFYAFLFLREIPSLEVLVGGVLIIGSSLWLTLHKDSEDLI